jgi:NTE family protein
VVIGGRRYVDGGVRSPTSLGVLARAGLDEVYVLAPMASLVADRPRKPHERLERQLRALITLALLREVKTLRAAGVRVTMLTPGPADLAAMGVNLMDPRRRRDVLETSLATSPVALAGQAESPRPAVA